jgi:DNA-binding CsgD family transcriptional regulator/PAS domain-containing protein
MAQPLPEELTDAVYRAAMEPGAWGDVMRLIGDRFPSSAQTFYFLDLEPHRVRPVSLTGIEPRWLGAFDELYFAPDNPWIRLSKQLHRPGVVRTNQRLDRFVRQTGSLYRSAYYHEWMRPQAFKFTLGNTLYADDGVVANITLLRPADMGEFGEAEVRDFEQLSRHLTRALQMSVQLERAQGCAASTAAFDAFPQPIALVDARRRLLYANPAMQGLLARRQGLALHEGRLDAPHPEASQRLAAQVAGTLDTAELRPAIPFALPVLQHGPLDVQAIPVRGAIARAVSPVPTVLLLVTGEAGAGPAAPPSPAQRYGYTRTEARLARLLTEGHGLREAADRLGVTYGTARVYLKTVFEKTDVHTQAQLVARLLGDAAGSPRDAGHARVN